MIRNYFKTAWRSLVNDKLHSFVNIAGLSLGMTVAILIGLWMHDELSFNKFRQGYYGFVAAVVRREGRSFLSFSELGLRLHWILHLSPQVNKRLQ